ncbi:glycosyltransferase family 2 protein [Jidongwangia harbinensis]|uniref:glycosyltransferase family 2 protein n=1 Tax=Jidongwangia harbinensis TaxID=2878561 RepID=UPI001CD9D76E|nr:glycosyltransferase family 2 protein [Jidongwangia harbinensis]MCA2217749.1 glycosyltransferase family 2 protein [Jidongwangia harbinensis]
MIVLIPAFQPGEALRSLLTDLRTAAPGTDIVVVDDGSGPESAPVLRAAGDLGATVLRHDRNRGKGTALKTGFRYAAEHRPGHDVVSADADGQHGVADILRVADTVRDTGRMVLGVRRFESRTPLRSRFGNTVTQALFRAATGQGVRDTQTGLRAYPAGLLEWLPTIPGERFEYEMNVLLCTARAGHPIEQVVVATTYLDGNASSHFVPLADSARIYRTLLRFAASSLSVRSRR